MNEPTPNAKNHIKNGFLATIGYLLSPLSWWNDLFINVPLAYLFSIPFSFINTSLYIPGFIAGYWLTNVIGFLLLHEGIKNTFMRNNTYGLFKILFISLCYTILVGLLAYFDWIQPPTYYLNTSG